MIDGPQHKIPWLAIVFGILALLALANISSSNGGPIYNVMQATGFAVPPTATAPSMPERDTMVVQGSAGVSAPSSIAVDEMGKISVGNAMMPVPYYPQYGGTPDAKDTREFNKMYYNANMRTRDVPSLARTLETLVRGSGGRVDQQNSSHDSGYISFVVPQDKFEAFRTEIEKLVDWRFLTVSINQQNLLPQKQAIEKQQDFTKMTIDELTSARKKEVSQYVQKKSDIQYQIDANERELALLANEMKTADQAAQGNIAMRQMQLYSDQSGLKNQISTLEKSHLNTINSIDAQISYQNGNTMALDEQTQNLMDNVATVDGTISLSWLSLWDFAQGYLPGYTIPGLLAALAILSFWWQRRREQYAM